MDQPTNSEENMKNELKSFMSNTPTIYCEGHFPTYPALPIAMLARRIYYAGYRIAFLFTHKVKSR